jgi:hypothetical protein
MWKDWSVMRQVAFVIILIIFVGLLIGTVNMVLTGGAYSVEVYHMPLRIIGLIMALILLILIWKGKLK